MDVGSREAVSSSAQLENWEAVVAEELNGERTGEATDQAVTSAARQRNGASQVSATVKRSRQQRESSPGTDAEADDAKDSGRPKLPRPDKKEPCPRCNSMDTKFCYYNNYNIKQPRFYCKSCQRYWTAGGALRNIAPGSGRRKSKSKALGRDARSGSALAEHLSAAAAVAQTGMFGLQMSPAYPALLAAAADPTGLLSSSAVAPAAYPQLLAGHTGLSGLKLAGVSQLPGAWGGGLAADIQGSTALREHLQAQLGAGATLSSSLGQQNAALDARLLLNGQQHGDDLSAVAASAGLPSAHGQALQQQRNDKTRPSSPSASPPPHQQQQVSSPQQPNSQLSQQPSPPQAQQNCSASEDPDADGLDVCVQGRRVRVKGEMDLPAGSSGTGFASSGLGHGNGMHGSSSLQNLQLASLSLPPSMASLAAVMGPGGSASNLGSGLHPLLSQPDSGPGSILDGSYGGLSRHQLQLALQHHQAMQQQESLQQLNGLLPHSSMTASALQAQQSLLHGLGHQGVSVASAPSSAAAAVAALDPLQRSALLQQAAGLGAVNSWLHGSSSSSGMLPSAAMAAAALESLQAQSLATSHATHLLQVQSQQAAAAPSVSGAADWLSLAAAAKGQGAASVSHPSAAAAAVAAAHAANVSAGSSAITGAAQMLQAQAAVAAASGGCGGGVSGWPGAGAFGSLPSGTPSWSLWSSYNNSASSNYAGYALQAAAAAAAYSNGR